MHDIWQQADQIVMSVQTAELRHVSIKKTPSLHLSCSLVNIARGQCMLEVEAGMPISSKNVGKLVIEFDRPVIRGKVVIPQTLYDSIISCLSHAPPRPIALSLKIATQLAVSLEGDLRIDAVTEVSVTDVSATLPLK